MKLVKILIGVPTVLFLYTMMAIAWVVVTIVDVLFGIDCLGVDDEEL